MPTPPVIPSPAAHAPQGAQPEQSARLDAPASPPPRIARDLPVARWEEILMHCDADTLCAAFKVNRVLAAASTDPRLPGRHQALHNRLGRCMFAPAEVHTALSSPPAQALLPHLTELNLTRRVDAQVVDFLAARTDLARLTSLRLSHNRLKTPQVAQLAAMRCPALRRLDLSRCSLGVPDLQALAEGTLCAGVTDLRLSRNIFTSGLRALTEHEVFSQLRRLDLSNNALKEDSCAALTPSRYLTGLTELWLNGNLLGRQAAAALSRASNMAQLRVLHLEANGLDDESLDKLTRTPNFTQLEHLSLHYNKLSGKAASLIASATFAPTLRTLDLGNNYRFGDEGVAQLHAATQQLSALQTLNLHSCGIDNQDETTKALSGFIHLTRLTLVERPADVRASFAFH